MEQFLENIKDFEVTTVARAQEALDNKETAIFFIGRKTALTGQICWHISRRRSCETKAHIYFINMKNQVN